MAKDKFFRFPDRAFDPTVLKAIAMAIHMELLEPEELAFWFEHNWSNDRIAKVLYKRVTSGRKED